MIAKKSYRERYIKEGEWGREIERREGDRKREIERGKERDKERVRERVS